MKSETPYVKSSGGDAKGGKGKEERKRENLNITSRNQSVATHTKILSIYCLLLSLCLHSI